MSHYPDEVWAEWVRGMTTGALADEIRTQGGDDLGLLRGPRKIGGVLAGKARRHGGRALAGVFRPEM